VLYSRDVIDPLAVEAHLNKNRVPSYLKKSACRTKNIGFYADDVYSENRRTRQINSVAEMLRLFNVTPGVLGYITVLSGGGVVAKALRYTNR